MKALLGITLAGILIASLVSAPFLVAKANAESYIFLQIVANFSDGTKIVVGEDWDTFPADITYNNKQLSGFTVKLIAAFTSPTSITGKTIVNPSISVMSTSDTYKAVPTTGFDDTHRCAAAGTTNCGQWDLWKLDISKATLENLIGTTSGNYASNLRASTTSTGVKITVGGSQLTAPALFADVDFTASNIIGGGGGEGPSGKIWTVIHYLDQAGNIKYSTGVLKSTPFTLTKLFTTNTTGGVGSPDIYTIVYQRVMFVDEDIYQLPFSIKYANPAATDNFKVTMEGRTGQVPKTYNDNIQRLSAAGHYQLLEMKVARNDIEGFLQATGVPSGEFTQLDGTLVFSMRAGTVDLRAGTAVYPVSIPESATKVNLLGYRLTDGGGGCDFDQEGTDCDNGIGGIFAGIAAALGIEEGQAMLLVAGLAITAVGVVVAKSGRKKGSFKKS